MVQSGRATGGPIDALTAPAPTEELGKALPEDDEVDSHLALVLDKLVLGEADCRLAAHARVPASSRTSAVVTATARFT